MSCNTQQPTNFFGHINFVFISFIMKEALFYARLHGLTTDSHQIIKSVVGKSVVHRYDKNHLPENSSGKSDGEFRNRIKKAADLVSSHVSIPKFGNQADLVRSHSIIVMKMRRRQRKSLSVPVVRYRTRQIWPPRCEVSPFHDYWMNQYQVNITTINCCNIEERSTTRKILFRLETLVLICRFRTPPHSTCCLTHQPAPI